MAKKKSQDADIDIAGTYSKVENYIEDNKQTVSVVVGAVALIIVGYFGYTRFILAPKETEASEQIFRAQSYFDKDSLNLALNGDGSYPGFLEIIDDFGGTKTANLANYYAGMCFLKLGEFEDAIEHLKDFSADDAFAQTLAWGAIGDAYTELGDLDKGISFYKKACKNNAYELITPFFLLKTGLALEMSSKFAEAKTMFETIKNEFPESEEGREIDKYIARVQAKI